MRRSTVKCAERLKPPLKWHGGKHHLASKIVALMPPHVHYVEPYFGGGTRHDFDLPNFAAGGKTKRRMTECLWCNFGGEISVPALLAA